MGHPSWTASSIGDRVTGISRPESEITKCTRLLCLARSIKAGNRRIKARACVQCIAHVNHVPVDLSADEWQLEIPDNNVTACHHCDGRLSLQINEDL